MYIHLQLVTQILSYFIYIIILYQRVIIHFFLIKKYYCINSKISESLRYQRYKNRARFF